MSEPVVARPKPCLDRKSTRLNSSHVEISYAVFCLKKKKIFTLGSLALPTIGRDVVNWESNPENVSDWYASLLQPDNPKPSCCGDFFFNDTATTEIYTLSLHDALPI